MDDQILITIIGVSSAILGSVVGGLVSYLSTRSMRRLEWTLSLREKEIDRNRTLYSEFLAESNRLMLLSITNKISDASDLTKCVAMESQIRMTSTTLGDMARRINSCVLSYHTRDETPTTKENFASLRNEFIESCKRDLAELSGRIGK